MASDLAVASQSPGQKQTVSVAVNKRVRDPIKPSLCAQVVLSLQEKGEGAIPFSSIVAAIVEIFVVIH